MKKATAAASLALVAAVYLLRLDRAAGLMIDDAWYILLGEALARGEGYRIISSAATAVLPSTPPAFPAMLAALFKVSPRFPDNILLLKSVSVAAMGLLGLAVFWYGARVRRMPPLIAGGVALATVLTPAFVFLATSTVMAECVFALVQLLALIAVERAAGGPRRDAAAAGAGVLAALALLVRSAGNALALAALLYLMWRRQWRAAVTFAAVLAVCLLPWQLYAAANQPSAEERAAHGGGFIYPYSELMRLRIGGDPGSGRATNAEILQRIASNIAGIAGRDIGGIVLPVVYRPAIESGEEVLALGGRLGLRAGSMGNAFGTMVLSLALTALMLIGYISVCRERITAAELMVPISLAVTATVPFFTFRYVVPLAPFAFLYLAQGLHAMMRRGDPWRPARIALLSVVALHTVDHAQYIAIARGARGPERIDWLAEACANEELFVWMRLHLTQPGAVATTNPALVYLMTGRKTVAIDGFAERWDSLKSTGVRYLVFLKPIELPPRTRPYTVLYQSPTRKYWVLAI